MDSEIHKLKSQREKNISQEPLTSAVSREYCCGYDIIRRKKAKTRVSNLWIICILIQGQSSQAVPYFCKNLSKHVTTYSFSHMRMRESTTKGQLKVTPVLLTNAIVFRAITVRKMKWKALTAHNITMRINKIHFFPVGIAEIRVYWREKICYYPIVPFTHTIFNRHQMHWPERLNWMT